MDKAVAERAVKALLALNAGRGNETHTTSALLRETKGKEIGSCGSPHCAGCHEVRQGVRIHPPKCGEGYRAWLERRELKGKVQ
jgi:mono/diheme cytochrome c family protein